MLSKAMNVYRALNNVAHFSLGRVASRNLGSATPNARAAGTIAVQYSDSECNCVTGTAHVDAERFSCGGR